MENDVSLSCQQVQSQQQGQLMRQQMEQLQQLMEQQQKLIKLLSWPMANQGSAAHH